MDDIPEQNPGPSTSRLVPGKRGRKSSVEYDDDEIKVICAKKEEFGKVSLTVEEKRKLRNYEYAQEQAKKGVKRARNTDSHRKRRASFEQEVVAENRAQNTLAKQERRASLTIEIAAKIQTKNTLAHRVARARPFSQYKAYLRRNSHHFWDGGDFKKGHFWKESWKGREYLKGFLFFWNKLEERILNECLIGFRGECFYKEDPEELSIFNVFDVFTHLKYIGEDLSVPNDEERKSLIEKFENNILQMRGLKELPFFQLRLYLQPDYYRIMFHRDEDCSDKNVDEDSDETDEDYSDETWEFIRHKLHYLFCELFPDLTENERNMYVDIVDSTLSSGFGKFINKEDYLEVFGKINSVDPILWKKTMETVIPKRLKYICPGGSGECDSCRDEVGNILTIFAPKIYHKHVTPAEVECVNLKDPNFWQEYGGDHILRAYQKVREERRNTPCPVVFHQERTVYVEPEERYPKVTLREYPPMLEFLKKYDETDYCNLEDRLGWTNGWNYAKAPKLKFTQEERDEYYSIRKQYYKQYPPVYGDHKTIVTDKACGKGDSLHSHGRNGLGIQTKIKLPENDKPVGDPGSYDIEQNCQLVGAPVYFEEGLDPNYEPEYHPYIPEWEWGRCVAQKTDPEYIEEYCEMFRKYEGDAWGKAEQDKNLKLYLRKTRPGKVPKPSKQPKACILMTSELEAFTIDDKVLDRDEEEGSDYEFEQEEGSDDVFDVDQMMSMSPGEYANMKVEEVEDEPGTSDEIKREDPKIGYEFTGAGDFYSYLDIKQEEKDEKLEKLKLENYDEYLRHFPDPEDM